MIFGPDGVVSFQYVSRRPRPQGNGSWVDFGIFDKNLILGPDGVAGIEFVSPRPRQQETGGWVDFDIYVISAPMGLLAWNSYSHGMGSQKPAVGSISRNLT